MHYFFRLYLYLFFPKERDSLIGAGKIIIIIKNMTKQAYAAGIDVSEKTNDVRIAG